MNKIVSTPPPIRSFELQALLMHCIIGNTKLLAVSKSRSSLEVLIITTLTQHTHRDVVLYRADNITIRSVV